MPLTEVKGKLQETNPGKTTNKPNLPGIKLKVIPPGQEPQPAELLAEDKGNVKGIMEAGSYTHQLRKTYSCKNMDLLYSLFCYE